jgi:hypothetical protein
MKTAALAIILAVGALAVSAITVVGLLGVRSAAAVRLQDVSATLRALAADSIETTITVRHTMQLDAKIQIVEPTKIDLTLDVADKIPIRLAVKVEEKLKVPIDLQIDELIGLESLEVLPEKAKIRVKADIDIDQPVRWRLANVISPLLHIDSEVPIDEEFEIMFPRPLAVKGKVPVKFHLQEEIMVPISFEVPVEQMLDLTLAIKQQALVGFPQPLHIVGEIPVVMEIPVKIPLQPTPVGQTLEKLAEQLGGLLGW